MSRDQMIENITEIIKNYECEIPDGGNFTAGYALGENVEPIAATIVDALEINGIVLHGHIEEERDFEITIHLPNSGMLIVISKRDISTKPIIVKEPK